MSRIDEAMKRAGQRAAAPGDPASAADTVAPEVADLDVPWNLDDVEVAPEAPRTGPRVENAGLEVPDRPRLAPEPSRSAGPVAAAVPVFGGINRAVSEKIVAAENIQPQALEQYRKLAATLHHAQVDRGIKVILVASAGMGEGKTLTATNVGLTLSESYRRRVLLIDADLRRPSLHDVFQVPNVSGLSDGLEGDVEHRLSLLQVSQTLTVLPAGRPLADPMGVLTSGRMRHILEEAREAFDWVIIDSPPVGMMTDANLLSAMVDGVVLIVSAGQTPYGIVQKSVEALGRERVLGVVLNRADLGEQSILGGGAYGYGYRYGYYGKR
jgi:capsular exopolysaccharide synthesis family protein